MKWVHRTVALVAAISLALIIGRAVEQTRVTSHHSLWGDEIFSVERFSGRGLTTTLSDYRVPNNHVLFNAINAVLPGRGSVEPLRARMVSFVAVWLGLIVGVVAMVKQRMWLALLVFALGYLGDDRLLGVHLQARGYGMLALFAVLVCLLLRSYIEPSEGSEPPVGKLVTIALCVALGALTVPTFLFFGGSVLLALFALRPTKRHFFTGLAVFVVVAGYFGWLFVSNHGLGGAPGGFFEGEFHDFGSVVRLVEHFALEGWPTVFCWIAIALVLLAPLMAAGRSSRRTYLWILWFGVVGSLTICLIIKRPLMHTVAHLFVPASFLLGFGLEALAGSQAGKKQKWLPISLAVLLSTAVGFAALKPRDPLTLWPSESWKELALTIDALAGGVGGDAKAGVWAPFRGESLEVYLPERFVRKSAFDAAAYRSGEQIIVASPRAKYADEAVDPEVIDSAAVRVSVRQKSYQYQQIAWNPPAVVRAQIIEAGPKPGTSSGKTFALKLQLPPQANPEQVLFFYSIDPIMAKPPVIRVSKSGGGSRKLSAEIAGTMWATKLPADTDVTQPLEVVYYSGTAGDLPPGFVAWLGKAIPDDYVRGLLYSTLGDRSIVRENSAR